MGLYGEERLVREASELESAMEAHALAEEAYTIANAAYLKALRVYQEGGLKGDPLASAKAELDRLVVSLRETSRACGEAADKVYQLQKGKNA